MDIRKRFDAETGAGGGADARRNRLINRPELALPNAASATAANEKFTKYLFNPENKEGWAKGIAFSSRLGYNKNNWEELQKEILTRTGQYPVSVGKTDVYGIRYTQKVILYGVKGHPANVIVGWKMKETKTWLSTAYLEEVKDD